MQGLHYVDEILWKAVRILAAEQDHLRGRLQHAWIELCNLQPAQIDGEIGAEVKDILDHYRDRTGKAITTNMSPDEAQALAESIVDLCAKVALRLRDEEE